MKITEKEVVELMESSNSEEEWNVNSDKVCESFNGYPDFWFNKIIQGGVLAKTQKKWEDKKAKSLVLTVSENILDNIIEEEKEGKITEEEKKKALIELLHSSCEALEKLD